MDMEHITILSNIGSASKKYSVYQGNVEIAWFHLEKNAEEFLVSYKINSVFEKKHIPSLEYQKSIEFIFTNLQKANVVSSKEEISHVALRIVAVHADFIQDMLCTPELFEKLKQFKAVDPIHIVPVLEEITLIQEFFGTQIKIYFISDSLFHLHNKRRVPLMFDKTLYTIGYHGLSCESVLSFLKTNTVEHSKLISIHLGGGSSVTAIKNGVSVYNSMEFSPLDGIIMSSRSGSIDPFLVLLYMKEHNLSYEQTLEHLYTQSGLKALSGGISSDLRVIREEAFKGNIEAKDAIIQYVDSIVSCVCKAMSYTQGADTIVFTGTIGYRAAYIREMVIEKLLWLGCVLDHTDNIETYDTCFEISAHNSKIKMYVIQVDEMKEMHKHAQKFLKNKI